MVISLAIPALGRKRQAGPWDSLVGQPNLVGQCQVTERLFKKKVIGS